MDLTIFAHDNTGTYRVLKLARRTKAGHVIQVLPGPPGQGFHRTWHDGGYVHDRSDKPPSTTSTGHIQPPSSAINECYARHDLVAGRLSECFEKVGLVPNVGAFLIDLTSGPTTQRLEVWYTQPSALVALETAVQASSDGSFHARHTDEDSGLARLVVVFTPK